jgi:[ribosomal protein S5]-alanine N-acetyltransferase
MAKVELRYQRVSDAKRYYEILNHPDFIYFDVKPKSIEEERKYLKENPKRRKDNFVHNYAIIYTGKMVGGCGIKVDQHSINSAELGYFIDRDYWGNEIAPKALRLLEKIATNRLGIERMSLYIKPKNRASIRVAQKAGYTREGKIKTRKDGKIIYYILYGKVK